MVVCDPSYDGSQADSGWRSVFECLTCLRAELCTRSIQIVLNKAFVYLEAVVSDIFERQDNAVREKKISCFIAAPSTYVGLRCTKIYWRLCADIFVITEM